MNLLSRIVRLPFVANHPAARLLGFAAVTAIDIVSSTPEPLAAVEPVVQFEILGMANKLIKYFLSSKEEQVSFLKWSFNAGYGLLKSIFTSLTGPTPDNQITVANVPNIMAGKIAGDALVPGLTSQVFVIALSPNMMIFLGFLFLCVKSIVIGTGIFFISRMGWKYFYPASLDSETGGDRDYIDVPSRGFSDVRNRYLNSRGYKRNV